MLTVEKCDKCNKKPVKKLLCDTSSNHMIFNCAWTGDHKVTMEQIIRIYYMIPLYIQNEDIFEMKYNKSLKTYELSGLILYWLNHYVCAFKDGKNWIFYDDIMYNILPSWEELVAYLIKNHYRPVGILYSVINDKIFNWDKRQVSLLTEEIMLKEIDYYNKITMTEEDNLIDEKETNDCNKDKLDLNQEINQSTQNKEIDIEPDTDKDLIIDNNDYNTFEVVNKPNKPTEEKQNIELSWKCPQSFCNFDNHINNKSCSKCLTKRAIDLSKESNISTPSNKPTETIIEQPKTIELNNKLKINANQWICNNNKCKAINDYSTYRCIQCKIINEWAEAIYLKDKENEAKEQGQTYDPLLYWKCVQCNMLISNKSIKCSLCNMVNIKLISSTKNLMNNSIEIDNNKDKDSQYSRATTLKEKTDDKYESVIISDTQWKCRKCNKTNERRSYRCKGCGIDEIEIKNIIEQKKNEIISQVQNDTNSINSQKTLNERNLYHFDSSSISKQTSNIKPQQKITENDWVCECNQINPYSISRCPGCTRQNAIVQELIIQKRKYRNASQQPIRREEPIDSDLMNQSNKWLCKCGYYHDCFENICSKCYSRKEKVKICTKCQQENKTDGTICMNCLLLPSFTNNYSRIDNKKGSDLNNSLNNEENSFFNSSNKSRGIHQATKDNEKKNNQGIGYTYNNRFNNQPTMVKQQGHNFTGNTNNTKLDHKVIPQSTGQNSKGILPNSSNQFYNKSSVIKRTGQVPRTKYN